MVFVSRDDLNSKDRLFFGFYVGKVVSNADPEKIARIKVRVPGIYDGIADSDLPWAAQLRMNFLGGSSSFGSFSVPKVGSLVVVVFDRGDPESPIYLGELVSKTCSVPLSRENYPSRFGWVDGSGQLDYIDQSEKSRVIEVGKLLKIKSNKDIQEEAEDKIFIKGENKVKIVSNTVEIVADEIKLVGSQIKMEKR